MDKLSPRQRQINKLQQHGLSYKEIASLLHLSLATVKTHCSHALARTQSHSTTHLVSKIHHREIESVARKINCLLAASERSLARQNRWPPFS
jgi:DNA-binding NarL/FixJ family response regulator